MQKILNIEKVKPRVKLIQYIGNAPRIIASAGKLTLSPKEFQEIYDRMTHEKINIWIKELVRRGHGSPLEHSIYIFEVTCSRVASHQLVRHRIASYTQLSQRYSDKYLRRMVRMIGEKIDIDILDKPGGRRDYLEYSTAIMKYLDMDPGFEELLDIVGEAFIIPPTIIGRGDKGFMEKLLESIASYYRLLGLGIPYEDARFILPQAVKTKILVSMNARELIENFLPLRMCSHAQWEIRYIAWRLWRILAEIHPTLFKYTGPRCVLNENRVRGEPCGLEDLINGRCNFTIERCPELVPRSGIRNCLLHASRDPWSLMGGRSDLE